MTISLKTAAARWAKLPAKRRQSVVDYYDDEIHERRASPGFDPSDPGDNEKWVEENQIVLDILDAIKPTRRRERS